MNKYLNIYHKSPNDFVITCIFESTNLILYISAVGLSKLYTFNLILLDCEEY